MPEISFFFGIRISMNYDDHNPPHFHSSYNEIEAVFDIQQGAIIKNMLPNKQA
jgi:hypothetical protein